MIDFDTENPTEQDLRQIDIHELLPQQEPFVMIGTLIHFNHTCTVTETEIKSDNIFVDNGCFSASGLMENIAQTCAARIGYVNKYILKKYFKNDLLKLIINFIIFFNFSITLNQVLVFMVMVLFHYLAPYNLLGD